MRNNSFLLIAYEYPPLNTGGSQRPARFANYLREKGFYPIVITADHFVFNKSKTDEILLQNYEGDIPILKTKIRKESFISKILDTGYFFEKDSILYRWKKYLKKAIFNSIKEYCPKFIIVTVPPFSLLPFIYKMGKKFDIPVIYDFRDPLSFWVSSPFPSKWHYLVLKRMERKCIASGYKTIVATPEMKKIYSNIYPELGKNIEVIFNSFKTFSDVNPNSVFDKLTVGYFGSFYFNPYSEALKSKKWWRKYPHQYFQFTPFKQDWKYRTPYYLFKTLDYLFKVDPSLRTKFTFIFAGYKPNWFDRMVSDFNLGDVVSHKGFLGKNELTEIEKKCNAYLITSSKFIDNKDYCIAGKTYEYFRDLKLIIAFVSEGDQKWAIKESGLGIICDPDNTEESAMKLKELIISGNIRPNPDYVFLKQFITNNQLSVLLDIVSSIPDPIPNGTSSC